MNYPQNFHNQIIEGNCLIVMSYIPDKTIDLILCDLPYAVTARNAWDVIIPFEPLWNQCRRIINLLVPMILMVLSEQLSRLPA